MPPPAPALLLAAIEEQGDQHAVHRATADTAEATVQVGRLDVVESQIVMTDSWVRRTGATSGVREGV